MTKELKTILLGIPCASGTISAVMVQSILQLHKPLPMAAMIVERQQIEKARNGIVLEALKNNCEFLFFVDDDNPIPPDTLELMVKDDKDIVIAPILTRNGDANGKHNLCAFYQKTHKIEGKDIRLYYPIEDFKDEGPLHRIDGGGTGCMLIKKKVLMKLYKEYQDHIFERGDIRFEKVKIDGVEYDRRTMSEDMEFCERAIDAGYEVWLDDRIRPIHLTHINSVQWGTK